jgi:hypothetical protein
LTGRQAAERDSDVVDWTATLPVSARECHADIAESSTSGTVGDRGRGIGKASIHHQAAANEATCDPPTATFTEDRVSVNIALHPTAGVFECAALRRSTSASPT